MGNIGWLIFVTAVYTWFWFFSRWFGIYWIGKNIDDPSDSSLAAWTYSLPLIGECAVLVYGFVGLPFILFGMRFEAGREARWS